MKGKLVKTLLGTFVFTGVAGINAPHVNNELKTNTNTNTVSINKKTFTTNVKTPTLGTAKGKDYFLLLLKEKGPDIITNTIGVVAGGLIKNLCTDMLLECGIDLRDGNAETIDNIYKEVQEIKAKLDVVEKKVDQYHSEDVMNNLYKFINYTEVTLKPMLQGGLMTIVNNEKAGTKTVEEIEKERENFFEANLKNKTLENGELLVNYVTRFANDICRPNDANQAENIFGYYQKTLGKHDKWSYQEYTNKRNFIAYLETTLLIATNMARYDLYYRTKGADEATVATNTKYLNNLITAVKNVNTLFKNELERLDKIEDERIKNHVVTYLPTNTKYSNRLGTLTFNLDDKERAGLVARSTANEFDYTFTPDTNLVNNVTNDYLFFKKEFKDDNYTINTYLKEAGFYTNDEKLFDTTAGLYYGDLYHNRCGFCNHDTETSIAYIDQKGNKTRKDVYKVSVYHNWIGVATDVRVDNLDKNYYFVFIKDNQTELAGRYADTYFNNVMEGKLTKLFPTVIEHNANQCYVKAEVKKGY